LIRVAVQASPANPSSPHQTIAEYLHGAAEPQEHRQTVYKRGTRTATTYRWLSGVPRGSSRCCCACYTTQEFSRYQIVLTENGDLRFQNLLA
jgi:hypothetical protein